jgi:hypothetical protein
MCQHPSFSTAFHSPPGLYFHLYFYINMHVHIHLYTHIPRHKRIHAYKCHVLVAGSIDILADCSKHFVFSSRISNDDHDDPQLGMVQNYAQL